MSTPCPRQRGTIFRDKIYVTSTEGRSLNVIVFKIPHSDTSGFTPKGTARNDIESRVFLNVKNDSRLPTRLYFLHLCAGIGYRLDLGFNQMFFTVK